MAIILTTQQAESVAAFKTFFFDANTTTQSGKSIDKNTLNIISTLPGQVLAQATVKNVSSVSNLNPLKAGTVTTDQLITWDMTGKAQQGALYNLVNVQPTK